MAEDTKGAGDQSGAGANTAGAGQDGKGKDTKGAGDQSGAGASSPKIDSDMRDELLGRARLAGATENSLTELGEALDKADVDDLPKFTEQITKLRKKNRKTYHVVSAGSVLHEGEQYEHGESLLLTEQEAAELGPEIVKPGGAPPPPQDIAARKGGKYKVAEERNVLHGGKYYGPGSTLELSAEDARSIGDYIVEA